MPSLMLIKEIADVLSRHGDLRCEPLVESEDEQLTLTLSLETSSGNLGILNLYYELREAVDMCQLRELAQRYDIKPEALEALLENSRCHRKS